eukprot:10311589-Ditylum_brightwellii.AAC.1
MVINTWTRSGKRSQNNGITAGKSIRPDNVSYTIVITALANNGKNRGEGAEKAEAILNRIKTIADKEGD